MADTWSPTLTAGHNSLSGGNLTATHTNGIYHDDKTLSNTAWTGKVYFEVTVVNSYTFGNTRVGIADSAQVTLDGNGAGGDSTYMVAYSGQTYADGSASTNYSWTGANNDEICVAIDIPNQLIWYRQNSGIWNNNAANDPAAGTGGISFAGGSLATVRGLVSMFNDDESVIARMTAANFQHTPPSGFAEPPGSGNVTLTADVAAYVVSAKTSNLTLVTPGRGLYRHPASPGFRLPSKIGIGTSRNPNTFFDARVGDAAGTWEKNEFFGTVAAGGNITITADVAAYSYSAIAAGVLVGRKIVADVAPYTYAAVDAGVLVGRKIVSDVAAYTYAAQAAGVLVGRRIAADVAPYVYVAVDAGMVLARRITADVAAYTYSAIDAGLRVDRKIVADVAAYLYDARDAGINLSTINNRTITADVAAYTYEAIDAGLTIVRNPAVEVVVPPGGNGGGMAATKAKPKKRKKKKPEEPEAEIVEPPEPPLPPAKPVDTAEMLRLLGVDAQASTDPVSAFERLETSTEPEPAFDHEGYNEWLAERTRRRKRTERDLVRLLALI